MYAYQMIYKTTTTTKMMIIIIVPRQSVQYLVFGIELIRVEPVM